MKDRQNFLVVGLRELDAGLVRGRSIVSMMAASVYAACRFTGTPRKIRDVIKLTSKEKKEITRCYRVIVRQLDLKMPIDDPMKFVQKIALEAGLTQKMQNIAIEILREARKEKVSYGKSPVGLAAAALYVANRLEDGKLTQCELAKVAGVTEVTVRNRYKGLIKCLVFNYVIL